MYGEEILGYIKTGLKAGPRWQHGFFWGVGQDNVR